MNISDTVRKAMLRVGLTAPEMRVYSALLMSVEPTASELSQKVGIPYSKIYEVLGSLEEKGWICSTDSRPTRYIANSPGTGLSTMKQRQAASFAIDQEVILRELGPLYERSDAAEKPDMLVLTGMAIKAKIISMAESCRREVLLAIPEAGQTLVPQAMPKLRALHDRGVDITVLATDRMSNEYIKTLSRVATVKIKSNLFGGGVISDRRYVMILLGPDRADAQAFETVAIWADHAGLAKFASEYFEYLLKDARIP